jgi:hypothetical protein
MYSFEDVQYRLLVVAAALFWDWSWCRLRATMGSLSPPSASSPLVTAPAAAAAEAGAAVAEAGGERDTATVSELRGARRQSQSSRTGRGGRRRISTGGDSDKDVSDADDCSDSFGSSTTNTAARYRQRQYKHNQEYDKYSSTNLYLEGSEELSPARAAASGQILVAEDFLQNPRDNQGFKNCSWKELDRGFKYALQRLLKAFAGDPKQRELVLPCWLSAADRYRVHVVAESWGLCHESIGEEPDRCIRVSLGHRFAAMCISYNRPILHPH